MTPADRDPYGIGGSRRRRRRARCRRQEGGGRHHLVDRGRRTSRCQHVGRARRRDPARAGDAADPPVVPVGARRCRQELPDDHGRQQRRRDRPQRHHPDAAHSADSPGTRTCVDLSTCRPTPSSLTSGGVRMAILPPYKRKEQPHDRHSNDRHPARARPQRHRDRFRRRDRAGRTHRRRAVEEQQ